MGRTGSGIEVRGDSIRIAFTLAGKQVRRTLYDGLGRTMLPTAPNLRHAHKVAETIRQRIAAGTFSMAEFFPDAAAVAGPVTVGRQLDTWLAGQRIEHSTKAGYESAVKFWKAAPADDTGTLVGNIALRSLKLSHLLLGLAARKDLKGKTVNNYVSPLREALELAVHDKLIDTNPAAHIPRAKQQKPPVDPFTREEAEAIIADMRQHYPEPVYNVTEWWFFTGVRTSELAGLQWPQVDLASSYMQIREALVRGKAKDNTKTNVSRDVILNTRALAALTRQKAHSYLAGAHVWLDPRYAAPWVEERAFRRSYWTPTLKRLGIRYRRPYDCRHTYATMMLMAGMAPAFCARQMGHSVEVFLKTYAKWIPGAGDAAEMAKLERSLAVDSTHIQPKK